MFSSRFIDVGIHDFDLGYFHHNHFLPEFPCPRWHWEPNCQSVVWLKYLAMIGIKLNHSSVNLQCLMPFNHWTMYKELSYTSSNKCPWATLNLNQKTKSKYMQLLWKSVATFCVKGCRNKYGQWYVKQLSKAYLYSLPSWKHLLV